MAHYVAPAVVSYSHERSLPGSILDNPEQIHAVEEVCALHLRQFFPFGDDIDAILVHSAKIANLL